MKNIKTIFPISKLDAKIMIPGSKSLINRALIIGALADGETILENINFCDDVSYMIEALKEHGIKIIRHNDSLKIKGGKIFAPNKKIYLGNAGTAMRFLASFSALSGGKCILDGNERMRQRPIQDLVDAINNLGAKAYCTNGCPPVEITGPLIGGTTVVCGSDSSQYLSSLLLSAPYAKKDVKIIVKNQLTSKTYVDITINIMKEFGVEVENSNGNYKLDNDNIENLKKINKKKLNKNNDNSYEFFIKSGQKYKNRTYSIEADASGATYFFGAAAITKGKVRVINLNPDSAQGDVKFADVLAKMGCYVLKGENFIEVQGKNLKGIEIDMNTMPDAVQTLAVVAAFSRGKTVIKNVANLRIKETDRIVATSIELKKMGIKVEELKDGLVVYGGDPMPAIIETYNDHRMAMAFAIAGIKIGIKIKNPECVSKSFPNFWEKLEKLKMIR